MLYILYIEREIYYTFSETSNGALRLVRDNHYSTIQAWSSGIAEIYYDDTWGNICDDAYFGYSEANVLCQQLAFTGVSSYGNSGQISLLVLLLIIV